MAEWIDVDDFVTGTIGRAEKLQDIWTNQKSLKNPMFVDNQLTDENNNWPTSSTSFADVDTTKLRHTFISYGGDLLAYVTIKYGHSLANGSLLARFELDSVSYGNTGGLARFQEDTLVVSNKMVYIFEDVSSGEHTLDVQFAVLTSGTATYYEDVCLKFGVFEF